MQTRRPSFSRNGKLNWLRQTQLAQSLPHSRSNAQPAYPFCRRKDGGGGRLNGCWSNVQ